MERRDFIKASCSLCIALGAGLTVGSLSSCAPLPIYNGSITGKKIAVPVSSFAEKNLQIIRAKGLDYDIALQRIDDGRFRALLLRCTHADNPLTYTGNSYHCSLHGSTFDTNGGVIHGPAGVPLQVLTTEIENNNIVILLQ